MLRILRIVGVLVFVLLIGISSSRIQKQYTSGKLFERYNSQRKADITLLVVSIAALVALSSFEYISLKRRLLHRGYRPLRKEQDDPKTVNPSATDIYSAPETQDQWKGLRTRSSRPTKTHTFEFANVWMSVLRVYCIVLPVFYGYLLVEYMVHWVPHDLGNPFLTLFISALLILSGLTCFGIFSKKIWGIHCGYPLSIFHLIVFPIGTAAGLFMLIALAGVAPLFATEARKQRKKVLRKNRAKAVMA
jgi:hypothetical protein